MATLPKQLTVVNVTELENMHHQEINIQYNAGNNKINTYFLEEKWFTHFSN